MTKGTLVAKHLSELNIVTTKSSLVVIKLDKVWALIFLSSLLESWNLTITIVSSSLKNNKLKQNNIFDLVLGEDIQGES